MKIFPALNRPGALVAAGIAAWPVMAISVVNAAGIGGCVRAHGVAGFIATHGAMMRATPSCPSTSVGFPGAVDSAVAVIVTAAIFTTFVHVLIAVTGTQGAEWVHRVAEAIGRMIAPELREARPPENFRLPPIGFARRIGQKLRMHMPWRRGPPTWGHAAL